MLITSVASTDVDLTTTGRVRNILLGAGATSTEQDAAIATAIRFASRWAESFVGYPLSARTVRETLSGFGRRNVMVSYTPIRVIRSVFDSTDTGDATELLSSEFRVEDEDAGFLSRDDGWEWTVRSDFDLVARPMAGQEYRPWFVTYTAGYTYGGMTTDSPNWSTGGTTSTGRTLPEDIEESVAQRAAAIVSGDDDIVAEQLGDLKVQYQTNRVDNPLPSLYEMLLAPYRRER